MTAFNTSLRGVAAALALSAFAVAPAVAQTATTTTKTTATATTTPSQSFVDVFGDATVTTFKAQVATTNEMENQVVVKLRNGNQYAVPVPVGFDLAEVRENQFVTIENLQGLILDVEKSSADQPGVTYNVDDVDLTDTDKLPEGLTIRSVTLTIQIEKIDRKAGTVTFEAPSGEKRTVALLHPEMLKTLDVKDGDLVDLTFYEGVGISISNT
ncbi:putative membrane protein [Amorphus suaedae]